MVIQTEILICLIQNKINSKVNEGGMILKKEVLGLSKHLEKLRKTKYFQVMGHEELLDLIHPTFNKLLVDEKSLEILKIISTLMKESAELDSLSKESVNEYIGSYLSDVIKAIESNSNSLVMTDDLLENDRKIWNVLIKLILQLNLEIT